MATNAIEVNLATAIDSTEQKENHDNARRGPNMQNETSSNESNGAAPRASPLAKEDKDGAPLQQPEQRVFSVITKASTPSPKRRERASSDPGCSKETPLQLNDPEFRNKLKKVLQLDDDELTEKFIQRLEEKTSPLQRRFSLADMDTENKRLETIQYAEPPTREQFACDIFTRDMLSKNITLKPMHNTRLICYIYDGGKVT
eukprot:482689_1